MKRNQRHSQYNSYFLVLLFSLNLLPLLLFRRLVHLLLDLKWDLNRNTIYKEAVSPFGSLFDPLTRTEYKFRGKPSLRHHLQHHHLKKKRIFHFSSLRVVVRIVVLVVASSCSKALVFVSGFLESSWSFALLFVLLFVLLLALLWQLALLFHSW